MLDAVARFAAGTDAETIPAATMERTKLILADCIGAMVGGAAEAEMAALSARLGTGGPALLIGTTLSAPAAQSAFVNGTAGTWLEMDEGNQFAKGHPGMHTVPAILGHAQAHGASGRDLLTALAIGYEVGARVGIATALRPSMHPHGTWGTICAAVGVQRLARADSARMREAINIAATLGLATSRRTMLEGGTVRNSFAGFANQTGLTIHDMLDAGFCGEHDGVSHVYGAIVSDRFDPHAMIDDLGKRWEVDRNYFKMHACCRYNHAALDALAQITDAQVIDPDAVERIEVETYSLAAELIDPCPRNVLAAKFSVPFAIATALVNRSTDVDSFSAGQVDNPAIRALAARVSVREDAAMTARLPDNRPARIAIVMQSGETLSAATETNRGDWSDPYPPDAIRRKYLSLTDRLWHRDAAEEMWDMIMILDRTGDAASLARLARMAVRA